jgi:hypothetical protein
VSKKIEAAMLTGEGKMVRISTIVILMVIGIFSLSSCSKPPDQKLYEEVVGTMSMLKAKQLFSAYPKSQYSDKLADEIVGWCKQEETEVCYKMLLDTLPEQHRRHKEIAAYYEAQFNKKKQK